MPSKRANTQVAPATVALVQMRMVPDPSRNLRHAVELATEAVRHGAQLICLPEMFRSQYFCQREDSALFDLAEPLDGPSTRAFRRLAVAKKVSVIVPIFERRAKGLYHNTALTITPDGRIAGHYRKMHIPDDPLYYEKYYFTPGDRGFQAIDTPAGCVGTLICWDQWYPEGARLTALQGADLIVYPTAIGWHPKEKAALGAEQHDGWRTIQRAHAIANGVYVAAVNRVGLERPNGKKGGDGLEFWGQSFLCDPFGVVLAEAPADRETILYGAIDPARIEAVRRYWPFLRDRRIDAYSGIAERFHGDVPGLPLAPSRRRLPRRSRPRTPA
ncbi:MAG TPA: carbon-nitrogen hydrolase [Planctomycetota bacterium]|nr:carbon-nitrogen hydrolase [Planctomycetota bacterium]